MELTKVVSALLRFFQWIAYSPRKELILRSWWLIGESKNRWAKLQLLLPEACSNSKGKAVCTTLFFLITESPEIQVTSGRLRKGKGWCFVRRGSWELSFTFIMLLGGRNRTVRALETKPERMPMLHASEQPKEQHLIGKGQRTQVVCM